MSTAKEKIPVTFAGINRQGSIPLWARVYDASRSTVADLCRESRLPEVSVVQSLRPQQVIEASDQFLELFSHLVHTSSVSARLVLSFKKAEEDEILKLVPILSQVQGLTGRIDLARSVDDLQSSLLEAVTKVLAIRSEQDPLGEIKTIAETGRALRGPKGRLDAKKVAKIFGVSLAELARQVDVSKQRISKTPDSEALQVALRPYERIARLRSVLPDPDFKVWLNTPNEHLEDGDAPIDYLRAGAREPLAAFAENMLTGAST